jgi:hypothetical protein
MITADRFTWNTKDVVWHNAELNPVKTAESTLTHAMRLLKSVLRGAGGAGSGWTAENGHVPGSQGGLGASIMADTWYHGSTATDLTSFSNDKIKGSDLDAPYTGIWLSTSERTSPAMFNPRAAYQVEPI